MTETSRYKTLIARFDQQLAKTARFVPSAFHVHSPESHDWGKHGTIAEGDPSKLDGDAGLDAYLDALVAAKLRLVCVTDHMKAGYAAALSERAKGRNDITVLPGMEVSCLIPPGHAERVHLLLAFPEGTPADVIERIFATQKKLEGSRKRTGEEVAIVDSLKEWRKLVGDQGGMFSFSPTSTSTRAVTGRTCAGCGARRSRCSSATPRMRRRFERSPTSTPSISSTSPPTPSR